MRLRLLLLAASWLLTSAFLSAKPSAPDWLQKAAATPLSTYDKKTKAAYLLKEITHDVRGDGTMVTTERVAIRILQPEGHKHATATTTYNSVSDKVRTAQAWLIPPTGDVIPYARKAFIEINTDLQNLHNEGRAISTSATGNAVTGSTFGYEFVIEEKSIFTQLIFPLQFNHPAATVRYQIKLPKEWTLRSLFINHPETTPLTDSKANTTTWIFSKTPAFINEPLMPSTSRIIGLMGVDLLAPPNWKSKEKLAPAFTSWNELARFTLTFNDPSCIVDSTITAKANQLTASSTSTLDTLRALGRYAQNISYGLISTNLARGGGIKPHPAPVILQRNYGDCKDKATILRALLRAKGIESHPIAIYSGDNQAIRPEWPCGAQFNHAILAICVPPEITGPAVLEHPLHGRLLIFDPTDPFTPLGHLPLGHYGSHILLEKENGDLITLPPPPADANTLRRTITATLSPQGKLTTSVTETNIGHPASAERSLLRSKTPAEYNQVITRWVTASIRAAKLSNLKNSDSFDTHQHTFTFDLSANGYAQPLRNKLLIFKPTLLSRRDDTAFTEEKRTHPIVFRPYILEETTTLTLPPGHTIEELPTPVTLSTGFATYSATCTAQDGTLTQTRRLEYKAAEIPAANYARVKNFFEKIIKAEQATAILQRPAPPPAPPSS